LRGNTKDELYKINSLPENNHVSEDDENLYLLYNEKEYVSKVGKPPLL
jgi:hypothetical protein